MTKDELMELLVANNFFVQRVSKETGLSRTSIGSLMRKFDIAVIRKSGERDIKISRFIKMVEFKRARNTWNKIKSRCYDLKNKDYKRYGDRGIKLQDSWIEDMDSFIEYCLTLPNAFDKEYSVDRIDNDKGYYEGNIKFSTSEEQCNNRSSNVFYEFNGKKQTIAQWAKEYSLTWEFIRDRIKLGFSIEEALTIPKGCRRDKNKCNFT